MIINVNQDIKHFILMHVIIFVCAHMCAYVSARVGVHACLWARARARV